MATSLPERVFYRTRQFFSALRPRVTARERREASDRLGPSLYALFQSMHPADQRHCLDVYQRLVRSGYRDDDVLTAALIHDAGKGRLAGADIRLWHRVTFVLLTPVPPLLHRAAALSHGIATLARHDEVSIQLAASHNASEAVIHLLEELDGRRTLSDAGRRLKAADDAS